MVNSGASANELTMLALNYIYEEGEIIIPPLTWISDISSVIFSGFTPVFCDINLKNLSFDIEKLKQVITPKAGSVVCHPAGFPFVHRGLVPESSDKYIVTTWLNFS